MKKSILTVILAAVICSITQTGFAADFVFKIAGLQVKKLPADIEKVRASCSLRFRKADGTVLNIYKESIFPVTQTTEGRAVLTGPFEMGIDSFPERESAFGYACYLMVFKTGAGWKYPARCSQTNSPTGYPCVDPTQYYKDYVEADHF